MRHTSAGLPQPGNLGRAGVNHVRVPDVWSHPTEIFCQFYWRATKGRRAVSHFIERFG